MNAPTSSPERCPLFWPEHEQHGVRYVALDVQLSEELAPLAPRLRELAAIGDALRSLQTREGVAVSPEAAAALSERTGKLLNEIADSIEGEPAEIIRMRARSFLEGAPWAEASIREGELYDSVPLTVICGPLCTWRLKTRTPLHTVVAATENRHYDELVRALDENLPQATAQLRTELDLPELALDESYPMRVTDMVACGGEANAYPKHFAYFLPEDENVKGTPGQRKKTIVFRNAYRDRFEVISRPLGEALFDGPRRAEETPVEGALLAWFRGHDIGHTATLPSTDYRWHMDLGHEPFMMIQEAVSDIYGLLLALTPSWLELSGLEPVDVCETFLAELLHYLRRGPQLYGDAGAAYIELGFLAENGFVDIDEHGRITWDAERLHEGSRELAKEFARTVLAPTDAGPCAEFVERYGWPTKTAAVRVLERLQTDLRRLPSALAYREAPAVPEGEPSAPAPALV